MKDKRRKDGFDYAVYCPIRQSYSSSLASSCLIINLKKIQLLVLLRGRREGEGRGDQGTSPR